MKLIINHLFDVMQIGRVIECVCFRPLFIELHAHLAASSDWCCLRRNHPNVRINIEMIYISTTR